jgi:acetolactate synthase-1/2/3 large subunit
MARGAGRVPLDRIPYVVDSALQVLGGIRHLVLAGAKAPVGFFAYPGKPGRLWPRDCEVHVLARVEDDVVGAGALADGSPLHGGPSQDAQARALRRAVQARALRADARSMLPETRSLRKTQ